MNVNGQVTRSRLSTTEITESTIARTDERPKLNSHAGENVRRNGTSRRKTGSPFRRRLTTRRVLVAAIGAVIAAGVGLAVVAISETPTEIPKTARILAVRTVAASPVTSYESSREYTGAIVARRISQLGFELAGKLTALHANEGDSVPAGTVLAQLDTEHLETNRRRFVARQAQAVARLDEIVAGPRDEDIAAARARVESVQAEVELLKLQTARHKRLVASKASSQDEYEQHAYGLKAREANLNEARHDLEELLNGTRKEQIEAQRAVVDEVGAAVAEIDVDLRKSRLLAPYDGTVARRLTDDGTVVEAGQPVFRLVEDQVLEAWIGLPTQAVGQLIEGSTQSLKIHGEQFLATVAGRFPEVDPATRTRTVVLRLDAEAARRVVHGQIVRLELNETVEADGFWLPLTSLTKGSRGLWTVLVVEEGVNRASQSSSLSVARRDVEVLHTASDRVLVRGTLNPGDRVVAGGTHRVVPGQRVRLASVPNDPRLP
jgi:RND family efflux transporter MFP subunit